MQTNRRNFVIGGASVAAVAVIALPWLGGATPAQAKQFPVTRTKAEWRKRLSAEQFTVLREAGTERAFTSPLNKEKRAGTFVCVACDQKLFSSKTKFESGTGWPSFWSPLPGGIGGSTDYKIGYARNEVHCARCGGHLGHVFDDGPKPTGKRYCMNGVAMRFIPA